MVSGPKMNIFEGILLPRGTNLQRHVEVDHQKRFWSGEKGLPNSGRGSEEIGTQLLRYHASVTAAPCSICYCFEITVRFKHQTLLQRGGNYTF
jgi:hypothetical protein